MEAHLDHRVIIDPNSEYQNLYSWSLRELDTNGENLGRAQVPWEWALCFAASELTVSDAIEVSSEHVGAPERQKKIVSKRKRILAKLFPANPLEEAGWGEPTYSMFGTNRTISDFQLEIVKLQDGDEQEKCTVWGCMSYTTELDYRKDTVADCIVFYFHVRPETFAEYVEKITASTVDQVILRVTGVAGFYSEWSPSISTSRIKVLTPYEDQVIENPSNYEIDLPRLGTTGEATLEFSSHRKLGKVEPETSTEQDDLSSDVEDFKIRSDEDRRVQDEDTRAQIDQQSAVADVQTVKILSSMRVATWVIAILLLLILVASR